jgi:enoyl-CoA hydratase/carnithine racemase
MEALVNFDKPLVAAVHGAAIGGGATMLTHCDFVYAGESTHFQMPFINLAVVPEFGSSYSVPARVGHVRAAEPILLGGPFDARRAAELGLVTQVISDKDVLARATETADPSWRGIFVTDHGHEPFDDGYVSELLGSLKIHDFRKGAAGSTMPAGKPL